MARLMAVALMLLEPATGNVGGEIVTAAPLLMAVTSQADDPDSPGTTTPSSILMLLDTPSQRDRVNRASSGCRVAE